MNFNEDLGELLRAPREQLDIEIKQWMDPADKSDQARFAKALLALRNHGGGYLIVGFKDGHPVVPDADRPANLEGFSSDAFNNIIKRYAEPAFHCTSHVVAHPLSGECYPVVVVPGGAKAPVRCRSDSPDGGKTVHVDTYYVRRPGPESSPPQSGAEWDALLERCLLHRKDELLKSFAAILKPEQHVGARGAIASHPFSALRAFRDAALTRLTEIQALDSKPGAVKLLAPTEN